MPTRSAPRAILFAFCLMLAACGGSDPAQDKPAKDAAPRLGDKKPASKPDEPDEPRKSVADSLAEYVSPWFRGDENTTDADLAKLSAKHAEVDLDGAASLTEAGLKRLANLTKATKISLRRVPLTDATLAVIAGLPELRELAISGDAVTNQGIASLAALMNLNELTLDCPNITDDAFKPLASLVNLRELSVYNNKRLTPTVYDHLKALPVLEVASLDIDGAYTDARIAKVAQLTKLRSLSLMGQAITDASAPHVAKITGLRTLHIQNVKMTDAGLRQLAPLPLLNELTIVGCPRITDEGVAALGALPALTELSINSSWVLGPSLASFKQIQKLSYYSANDPMMAHLAGLTQLRELDLNDPSFGDAWTTVSSAGLAHLANLKQLQSLSLNRSNIDSLAPIAHLTQLHTLQADYTAINDAGLKPIANLKALKRLDLRGTNIKDVSPLAGLRNLEYLNLETSAVTDDAVPTLSRLRKLSGLGVAETQITKRGAARLRRELPDASIRLNENWTIRTSYDAGGDKVATDDELAQLPSTIETIHLYKQKSLTPAGFAHLKKLPDLRKLTVSDMPLTDELLKAIGELTGLEDLSIYSEELTDASLVHLAGLKNLSQLRISSDKLTPACLATASQLTELRELHLGSVLSSLDDDAMAHVSRLVNLREISLGGNKVTGVAVDHLAKMTGLEQLNLSGDSFGDAEFAKLASLKQLRKIKLWLCDEVTDRGLSVLAAMPDLETVEIARCEKVKGSFLPGLGTVTRLDFEAGSDEALGHVASLKQLTELDLTVADACTAAGLLRLRSLTNLQKLELSGKRVTTLAPFEGAAQLREIRVLNDTAIDNAGIAAVANMKNLAFFWSSGNPISDLTPFSKLPQLKSLRISRSLVNDASLPALYGLHTLESGDFDFSEVTPEGIAKLKQALPKAWSISAMK